MYLLLHFRQVNDVWRSKRWFAVIRWDIKYWQAHEEKLYLARFSTMIDIVKKIGNCLPDSQEMTSQKYLNIKQTQWIHNCHWHSAIKLSKLIYLYAKSNPIRCNVMVFIIYWIHLNIAGSVNHTTQLQKDWCCTYLAEGSSDEKSFLSGNTTSWHPYTSIAAHLRSGSTLTIGFLKLLYKPLYNYTKKNHICNRPYHSKNSWSTNLLNS